MAAHVQIVPADPCEPITPAMWDEFRAAYPHPERYLVAIRLALDLDTCRDLLLDRPVDPSRVDKVELDKALTASLVQLVRPLDVLHGRAA